LTHQDASLFQRTRHLDSFFGQSSKIDKPVLELQKEKAHSLIFLSLFDEVLYEVFEELTLVPTPQGYWIEDYKRIGLELIKKALGFS